MTLQLLVRAVQHLENQITEKVADKEKLTSKGASKAKY